MCKQGNGCVRAGIAIASRLAVDECDTRNNHPGAGGFGGQQFRETDGRLQQISGPVAAAVEGEKKFKKIQSVVLHRIPAVRADPFAHRPSQLQQSGWRRNVQKRAHTCTCAMFLHGKSKKFLLYVLVFEAISKSCSIRKACFLGRIQILMRPSQSFNTVFVH